MTHELIGQLTARKETFSDNPVSVEQLGELIDLVQDGKITGKTSFLSNVISINYHYQGLRESCY